MKVVLRSILIVLTVAILFITKLSAQDAPVYEQYAFDNSLLNPAFIGLVDVIQLKAVHRQQWLNFGSAHTPNTSFLLFRSRLKERDGGLGGYIYNDINGANQQTGLQFNGSFQFLMKTKRKTRTILSFGFGATVFVHSYDESSFERDIYDPIITYSKQNYIGYDANFGALLTHGGLIAGVSFNNLLQWTNPVYNQVIERSSQINTNMHVGKIFWLTSQIQLSPLVVYKTNWKHLHQVDLGLRVKLLSGKKVPTIFSKNENEVVLGLIYKQTLDVGNISPLSICPMLSVVFKGISISYLCDIGLTHLQKYHYGSHQLALGFRLYRDSYTTTGKHNEASMVYEF